MPAVTDHLIPILSTVFILGFLIFVHELGHFLACRLKGVGVEKFSIGFGPEIAAWQGRETRYSIAWIPFGGFVKPQGETVEEVGKRGKRDPRDYLEASRPTRALILVAGVAMNYLLAYFLFLAVLVVGRPVLSSTIGGFMPGYPAETSGLKAGDKVKALNGIPVGDWQMLTLQIMECREEVLEFLVARDGREETIQVTPRREKGQDLFGRPKEVPRVGILPGNEYAKEQYPFVQALGKAAELEWRLTALTYEAMWHLATGQLSLRTVSGPIGIMTLAGSAAKTGLVALLQLMAVLSVSLAVVNLLPIPALDGGHLLFLVIEAIRRKPVSIRFQERLTQVGFYALMVLMVAVVFNDLVNIGFVDRVKSFIFR